ncbi:MAG: hypothetical protein GX776_06140 [Oxalobacter sp.]|nr:hypothetical protein [Oxalobacter sp.]
MCQTQCSARCSLGKGGCGLFAGIRVRALRHRLSTRYDTRYTRLFKGSVAAMLSAQQGHLYTTW